MRILIRAGSLLVMLILGVFLGIDSAEKSMQKMQGTEGATRTVKIVPKDGKVDIFVMGKKIETPIKQSDANKITSVAKQAEEGASQIAGIGNKIGSSIKSATREAIDFLFGWMK